MPDALDDYITESLMLLFVLLTFILELQGGYKCSKYNKWTDGSVRRIDTQIAVIYFELFFPDSLANEIDSFSLVRLMASKTMLYNNNLLKQW